MKADKDFWCELLQDGDSEVEQFEGFMVKVVAESELRCIKKDRETARTVHELENGEGGGGGMHHMQI